LSFKFFNEFLICYDSNGQSKEIGFYLGDRYYEWYFQKDVDLITPSKVKPSDYYLFIMMVLLEFTKEIIN